MSLKLPTKPCAGTLKGACPHAASVKNRKRYRRCEVCRQVQHDLLRSSYAEKITQRYRLGPTKLCAGWGGHACANKIQVPNRGRTLRCEECGKMQLRLAARIAWRRAKTEGRKPKVYSAPPIPKRRYALLELAMDAGIARAA